MPFESTLSSYVSDSGCYTSNSPGLVGKDFPNGPLEVAHAEEDSENPLDVDDTSNDEARIDQDKFLLLSSRNFYQDVPTSIPPTSVPFGTFNSGKVFNPYQGRLSLSNFEEENSRPAKSPTAFEPSNFVDYAEKLKDAVGCEEQDQKLFMTEEDGGDVFVNKPIYPWMVDSRHNTKNRQPQAYDGDKEQFNQYLGKFLFTLF